MFTVAWCALGFIVLRALLELWLRDRRIALWTALAVTAAFAFGAFSPFALWPGRSAAPTAPPNVAMPVTAASAAAAVPKTPGSCRPGETPAASTARGHLDTAIAGDAPTTLADGVALPANTPLRFSGWILAGGGPGRAACILVDGVVPESTGSYGTARPDVSAALRDENALHSGFSAIAVLARGVHRLSAATVDERGALVALPSTFAVTAK